MIIHNFNGNNKIEYSSVLQDEINTGFKFNAGMICMAHQISIIDFL